MTGIVNRRWELVGFGCVWLGTAMQMFFLLSAGVSLRSFLLNHDLSLSAWGIVHVIFLLGIPFYFLPHLLFFLGKPTAAENLCRALVHMKFLPGKSNFNLCLASILGFRGQYEESVQRYDGILENVYKAPFSGWLAGYIEAERLDVVRALGENDPTVSSDRLKKTRRDVLISRSLFVPLIVVTLVGLPLNFYYFNSKDRWACIRRGDLFYRLQNYPAAVRAYTEAIISRSDSTTYYYRASACYRMGQPVQAFIDCTKAIALNPNDARFYELRADSDVKLGGLQYELRADPDVKLGGLQSAVDDYTSAIKLKPKIARLYYYRGETYQRLDRKDLADRDKETAEKLGYKNLAQN